MSLSVQSTFKLLIEVQAGRSEYMVSAYAMIQNSKFSQLEIGGQMDRYLKRTQLFLSKI
jgi:hypothetical protein